MKLLFIKSFLFIGLLFSPTIGWSAECNLQSDICKLESSKKCSPAPDQLTSDYYIVIGNDENCCCHRQCVSGANFVNGNCYCAANTYKDNNSCAQCPSGYPSSTQGNNNSENECYKNCPACTKGTNVATCTRISESVNAPDGTCKYTTSCETGYHHRDGTENTDRPQCDGNKYTVNFNTKGGATIESINCTYGQSCQLPSATKGGATFAGWATTSYGSSVKFNNSLPATWTTDTMPIPSHGGQITLYAVWSECENPGGNYATEWDNNSCVIKTCRAGYYVHDAPDTDPKVNGCYTCIQGYYCPGNNDSCSLKTDSSLGENPKGICNCNKGYYCPERAAKENPCPRGATTEFTNTTNIEKCIMVRGNNGTKFCDSVGCFYLPGTGNIYY